MSINHILVTGGAGFIGSHTVDLLLDQGKEVIVLDNLFSGRLSNLNLQHPNLDFIEGDVLHYDLLQECVSKVDAVLHLAAIVSVQLSIEDPIYSFQVNTQGFLHLLQAINHTKRHIRLVYASSAAVYGELINEPSRDDAPLKSPPLSPYALQKIHTEDYAHLYQRLHGLPSLALRYFNVYGKRQDPSSPYSGVISRFFDAYQKDQELVVFGDGMQSRDFIYVADVARANLLALTSDYQGTVNIATGHKHTLLNLISSIEKVGNKKARVKFAEPRLGDIKSSYGTTIKASQHLNFDFSTGLEEGMRLMFVP